MTNPTKYISYLRVSTDKQGRSGLGLESQRHTVNQFVGGDHGNVLAEFVEVESGRRSDRPKLAQAFSMCRIHNATLVVAKLDRLARDAHFLLGLKDAGIEFVACDMPSANRVTVSLIAVIAEEEARLISVRTKAALAAAKARGTKLGRPNLTKQGRKIGGVHSGRVRLFHARQRANDLKPVIEELFEQGIRLPSHIARHLNEQSIPTARGGAWGIFQVQRLLRVMFTTAA